jgi:hypothetical protein
MLLGCDFNTVNLSNMRSCAIWNGAFAQVKSLSVPRIQDSGVDSVADVKETGCKDVGL